MTPVAAEARLRDRYELVSRIATGGMGEVWRAADQLLGREVAIKVLKAELTGDPHFLERFRREARHTAALTHPGIAQVYDYAEEPGWAHLVMELVPGEPLSRLLRREGAVSAERMLDILGQAALAIHAAHRAGVVHRDVKPGNVLVTPEGTVKITDFGIARAATSTPLTQTGRVMGTAQYLSPEQAAGRTATPASDIYALGVVAYECLAGHRPFENRNQVALAEAHLREPPPPLPPHVPSGVRNLVESMLAKDPDARPATAAEVAARMTALRDRLGRPLPPPQPQLMTPSATALVDPAPPGRQTAERPAPERPAPDRRATDRRAPDRRPAGSAGPAGPRTSHRAAKRRALGPTVITILAILVAVLALIGGGVLLGHLTAAPAEGRHAAPERAFASGRGVPGTVASVTPTGTLPEGGQRPGGGKGKGRT